MLKSVTEQYGPLIGHTIYLTQQGGDAHGGTSSSQPWLSVMLRMTFYIDAYLQCNRFKVSKVALGRGTRKNCIMLFLIVCEWVGKCHFRCSGTDISEKQIARVVTPWLFQTALPEHTDNPASINKNQSRVKRTIGWILIALFICRNKLSWTLWQADTHRTKYLLQPHSPPVETQKGLEPTPTRKGRWKLRGQLSWWTFWK